MLSEWWRRLTCRRLQREHPAVQLLRAAEKRIADMTRALETLADLVDAGSVGGGYTWTRRGYLDEVCPVRAGELPLMPGDALDDDSAEDERLIRAAIEEVQPHAE